MSRPPSPPTATLHPRATDHVDQGDWQLGRQQARSGVAPHGAAIARGSWSLASSPAPWTPEARDALAADFQATLQQGVHGLCFSPYLEGQQPGSQVSEAQIRDRLAILRPHAGWVRTFSCTDGHEQTPRIAHALGLKTLVGAWLGTDAAITNARSRASSTSRVPATPTSSQWATR